MGGRAASAVGAALQAADCIAACLFEPSDMLTSSPRCQERREQTWRDKAQRASAPGQSIADTTLLNIMGRSIPRSISMPPLPLHRLRRDSSAADQTLYGCTYAFLTEGLHKRVGRESAAHPAVIAARPAVTDGADADATLRATAHQQWGRQLRGWTAGCALLSRPTGRGAKLAERSDGQTCS